MINRYREYLSVLDKKLNNMFSKQSAFIKCKKGCVYCCKNGEYPMSELEYVYLMTEYNNLSSEIKQRVDENIKELISNECPREYTCPFLLGDICSVYNARAIICRTFGLISFYKDERKKIPFCVDMGLNYSEVYNKETGKLEKVAPDGTEPMAHNVDRRTLRSKVVEKEFDIFFGEDKSLYNFLKEDFSEK